MCLGCTARQTRHEAPTLSLYAYREMTWMFPHPSFATSKLALVHYSEAYVLIYVCAIEPCSTDCSSRIYTTDYYSSSSICEYQASAFCWGVRCEIANNNCCVDIIIVLNSILSRVILHTTAVGIVALLYLQLQARYQQTHRSLYAHK